MIFVHRMSAAFNQNKCYLISDKYDQLKNTSIQTDNTLNVPFLKVFTKSLKILQILSFISKESGKLLKFTSDD